VPEGVSVSPDALTLSRAAGPDGKWRGAVVEPAFGSDARRYAEWAIEAADAHCHLLIGVTDLDAAPPAGVKGMCHLPGSRMYYCCDSRAYPGARSWGAAGRRAAGDRVGVLVERGCVWVYVNGARLGPGPMATDLPRRVPVRPAPGIAPLRGCGFVAGGCGGRPCRGSLEGAG
jgi:hypothetical protein